MHRNVRKQLVIGTQARVIRRWILQTLGRNDHTRCQFTPLSQKIDKLILLRQRLYGLNDFGQEQ